MVPLKPLVLCSLLFTWGGCLQMRNDVPGVNTQEESVEETADDECSTDEEQNTIPERMTYQKKITDDEIKVISLEIWNSVADLDVQYNGTLDAKGNGKLFNHRAQTDNVIDQSFKSLFPFYKKYRGVEDPCESQKSSKACIAAQNLFLGDIFKGTGPIQVLYNHLKRRGIFTDDYNKFKTYLKTMWFDPYNRLGGTVRDSSAFEHVFLGEITQKGDVAGMHNWMRMYIEERNSHFKLNKDPIYNPSSQPLVADAKFTWEKKYQKTQGSTFFMKKSPAVEIALYTLCFMARPYNPIKPCWIDVGPFRLEVKAIPLPKNKSLICTAYPVIP